MAQVTIDSGEFPLLRNIDVNHQPSRDKVITKWIWAFHYKTPEALENLPEVLADIMKFNVWELEFYKSPEEFLKFVGIYDLDLSAASEVLNKIRNKRELDRLVREMRPHKIKAYAEANPEATQAQMAEVFGVSQPTINADLKLSENGVMTQKTDQPKRQSFGVSQKTVQRDLEKYRLLKALAAQEQAEALLAKAENEWLRATGLEKRSPGAVPTLSLNNYQTAVDTAKANLSATQAAVEEARLDLSYTEVKAPANGFVTNLRHHVGAQVMANNPVVALIDEDSFWIEGFFKETDISDVDVDKTARVTLLSEQSIVLEGHVESVGYGISKVDGSTGYSLLPTVNPNFQWIRLAQRIPVKVKLNHVPDDVQLRVGMTASVQVHK